MDNKKQPEILFNQYQTQLSKNSLSYPWNIQTSSIIQTPPIVLSILQTPMIRPNSNTIPSSIINHNYIPKNIDINIAENDWVLLEIDK